MPSEDCEGESDPGLSPSFGWFTGNPWLSWQMVLSHHLSACGSFSVCDIFYKDTSHIGLGAHLIPV